MSVKTTEILTRQQAIDNLKAIINSKDKIIEIEPPIEDTAQILLDCITNLQKEYKKKSCKIYQEVVDDIMSEKIELEDKITKAIEYIDKHTIEWKDDKFEDHNIMVKFNEYSNPQALKDILGGKQ